MKTSASFWQKSAAVAGILSVALFTAAPTLAADTIAPTIVNVSSAMANGDYTTGQVITATVQFSEPVIVTGTSVWLQLASGSSTNFAARYASGSGTDTLTFTYTVQSTDHATDLDYRASNSFITLFSTVKDAAGNAAIKTLPAPGAAGSLSANKDISLN